MDALPGYVATLRKGTGDGAVNGRQWLIKEGMTAVTVSAEDRATMQKAAVADRRQLAEAARRGGPADLREGQGHGR